MRPLLVILFISISGSLFSQSSEMISVVPSPLGGLNLVYQGQRLTQDQIGGALHSVPGARALYKKGKLRRNYGSIFGFAGGFFLGATLYYTLGSDRDVKLWVPIAGAGLGLASIPLMQSGKKRIIQAVYLYNESVLGLHDTANSDVQLVLGAHASGVGLRLQF